LYIIYIILSMIAFTSNLVLCNSTNASSSNAANKLLSISLNNEIFQFKFIHIKYSSFDESVYLKISPSLIDKVYRDGYLFLKSAIGIKFSLHS